jgi:hypothetical protein
MEEIAFLVAVRMLGGLLFHADRCRLCGGALSKGIGGLGLGPLARRFPLTSRHFSGTLSPRPRERVPKTSP